jgi:hypothetical protein
MGGYGDFMPDVNLSLADLLGGFGGAQITPVTPGSPAASRRPAPARPGRVGGAGASPGTFASAPQAAPDPSKPRRGTPKVGGEPVFDLKERGPGHTLTRQNEVNGQIDRAMNGFDRAVYNPGRASEVEAAMMKTPFAKALAAESLSQIRPGSPGAAGKGAGGK